MTPRLVGDLQFLVYDTHVFACCSLHAVDSTIIVLSFLFFDNDQHRMWILECDGDFLQGKRLWLKPGQRYLFGRVKKDGVRFLIEHKSISRKHFVIEVDKVKEGDGSHIHTRSKVTVTDLNSKGGTQVDGKPLKDGSLSLDKSEHYLKPGSYPTPLRIKWSPVILTFSLTPKEMKTKDPLKPKRDRLEQLDVKTILEYVTNTTTHVVAAKRNTAKGLQALINGQFIVDEPYVDALVYAATPADLSEEENASQMEQDFDESWPKPENFLPPAGKEPTVQPPESYAPNPQRENIFESYAFVFVDRAQFDTLMPVITAGHGKALFYSVTPGETTVEEVVTYMCNTAGDKGFGDPSEEANEGGVVLVRHNKVDKKWDTWFSELVDGVSMVINQRLFAQGEFLDAILANDPTRLRRSLNLDSTVPGTLAPPSIAAFGSTRPLFGTQRRQTSPARPEVEANVEARPSLPETRLAAAQEASPLAPEPPKKRSRLRGPVTTRIKTFDDEFDANSIPSFVADDEASENAALESQTGGSDTRRGSVQVLQEERGEEREGSLKRARPASDSEEDMVDELLPAATAMKRRKLEMEKTGLGQAPKEQATPVPVFKPKKKEKEIDIREAARKRREAEEEAERKERERDQAALVEIDHVKPANLVLIAEMPLRVGTDRSSRAGEHGGLGNHRWDERWNGRKNFKKFRRKGDTSAGPRRNMQNVIVPLVEVKKHSYGIGDRYWDRGDDREGGPKKKKGTSQGRGQLLTQTQAGDNDDAEENQTSASTTRLQREAAEIVGALDMDSPRRTRLADQTQSQQTGPTKRPASGAGVGLTKRQKTIQTKPASDESDSDDLKFRFGRRNNV